MSKKLSEKKKEKIYEQYLKGERYKTIAEKNRVSLTTIWAVVKEKNKNAIGKRKRGLPRKFHIPPEKFKRLYYKTTYREMAEMFKVSRQLILLRAKELGIDKGYCRNSKKKERS